MFLCYRMAPNNSKETLNWTRHMDDALIDAFMIEYNEGRKVNGTFTSTAYDNIVRYLSALFGKQIDKDKVKNRWKTLKRNFSDVYDIFKSLSGFTWNPTTHLWDAEPEVWDTLIEAKPKAAQWRNNPFPNYEKMLILYGVDRASGDEGETMREWRKRRRSQEEVTRTVKDIDNLVSQGRCSLQNDDDFVELDGQNNSPRQGLSPEEDNSPIANSACSKRTKGVSKEHENNLKELTGAICRVADALDRGAEAILQGNIAITKVATTKMQVPQLFGEELCKMLEECGIETEKIPDIYWFLMTDVDKLRTTVQCPLAIRKQVIMKMFYGSS
ncbi:uncharacterized protein LOC114760079 [Neltuma alba]|uniref:uncharacterized protein LOC114760079 n=1 Tax=Neltuma alba TaxID=207710 RepID=UPI0010A2FB90|nr:uncharacterized protein LOC114760079 [Prosopis alba]